MSPNEGKVGIKEIKRNPEENRKQPHVKDMSANVTEKILRLQMH